MIAGPACHGVLSISYRKYLATFQCVLIANVSKQEVIYCYRKTPDGIIENKLVMASLETGEPTENYFSS